MRTIEEEYNYIKAQFISLSRAIHLGYDIHDPLFQVVADAVRSVFKAEPINKGARGTRKNCEAKHCLTGIMILNSNITHDELSRNTGCLSHTSSTYNYRKFNQLCKTDTDYRENVAKVQSIVDEYKNGLTCST